jgi:hypothetical protein
MTMQSSTPIPSQSSVPMLRITGWAGVALAVVLFAEVADLSTRGHGPVVVLWVLALTASGVLGVSVGFATVKPAVGGFGSRWRQQPRRYHVASLVAILAFVVDLAVCFAGTAQLG